MDTNMLKMAEENLQVRQPTLNPALRAAGLLGYKQNSEWEFVIFTVTDNEYLTIVLGSVFKQKMVIMAMIMIVCTSSIQ